MPSPVTIFDLLRAVLNGTWSAIRVDTVTASLPSGSVTNAPVRIDYTTVNGGAGVSTSAYTQLVASTTSASKTIHIFDSSGRALYLATGAAASEVDQIFIEPGGTGPVGLSIPAGTRLSIKAVDAAATKGQLLVAFLG